MDSFLFYTCIVLIFLSPLIILLLCLFVIFCVFRYNQNKKANLKNQRKKEVEDFLKSATYAASRLSNKGYSISDKIMSSYSGVFFSDKELNFCFYYRNGLELSDYIPYCEISDATYFENHDKVIVELKLKDDTTYEIPVNYYKDAADYGENTTDIQLAQKLSDTLKDKSTIIYDKNSII